MIIDSSAIVAIMRGEPDAQVYVDAIVRAKTIYIPAPILLELCMVLLNTKVPDGLNRVNQTLRELGVVSIPFTPQMAELAVAAFLRFGKGRGHKAQLNFADCMSYATAKVEAMPLLFKGEDFNHTDVVRAL